MEDLRRIAATPTAVLIEQVKATENREREMMARQNKVVPLEHGNRRARRAHQARLRQQAKERA